MLRLIVDTSIQGAVLGITDIETKTISWSLSIEDNRVSSTLLSSGLKEGLDSISKKISDIKEIVVSVGPGSFTGIKVGIAFCYGIKTGLRDKGGEDIVLDGKSSLQLIYRSLVEEYKKDIILVLPSTRNQGFIVRKDEVSNLDISRNYLKIFQSLSKDTKLVLIEEWNPLEDLLKENGINLELDRMDIKKLHNISLKELSFVEIVNKKGQNQYSVVEPLYCREPSVFGK